MSTSSVRRLHIVLGDQLDRTVEPITSLHPNRDLVWMAEVTKEASKVPSHKARIALFLSAMRHFRDDLQENGQRVRYHTLGEGAECASFETLLGRDLRRLEPSHVSLLRPGEWSVREEITQCLESNGVSYEVHPDPHFLCSLSVPWRPVLG